MVQACHENVRLCLEVSSGMTNWEDTPEQTQDTLEGIHFPCGLGEMRDPPRGDGTSCWGKTICVTLHFCLVLIDF